MDDDDARTDTSVMWTDAIWLNSHPEGLTAQVIHRNTNTASDVTMSCVLPPSTERDGVFPALELRRPALPQQAAAHALQAGKEKFIEILDMKQDIVQLEEITSVINPLDKNEKCCLLNSKKKSFYKYDYNPTKLIDNINKIYELYKIKKMKFIYIVNNVLFKIIEK